MRAVRRGFFVSAMERIKCLVTLFKQVLLWFRKIYNHTNIVPCGVRSVNDSAAKDSLLRIPNKKTNLAVFPALHKNSLQLEIPLIWSVLLKNHQIPVAVGCRQVSSRVSSRSLAAPSLTDHTVCRLDVCLNPMLEWNAIEQLFSHSSTCLPCNKLNQQLNFRIFLHSIFFKVSLSKLYWIETTKIIKRFFKVSFF
jgi:hypothetical protein